MRFPSTVSIRKPYHRPTPGPIIGRGGISTTTASISVTVPRGKPRAPTIAVDPDSSAAMGIAVCDERVAQPAVTRIEQQINARTLMISPNVKDEPRLGLARLVALHEA